MRQVELDALVVGVLDPVQAGWARTSASPAGASSSGAQRMKIDGVGEERRARRRAQQSSGLREPRYGSAQMAAPYSETARSKDRSQRHVLASGADQREARADLVLEASGRRQLRRRRVETDDAGGAARASQAEMYAVPQPISTTSLPATSGSTPTSASGTRYWPQVNSSVAQSRRPATA